VLGVEGHGPEWSTVFNIGLNDWTLVWHTMVESAVGIPIKVVHDRSPFGFTCGVDIWLTVNCRSAPVTLSLHYSDKDSPPRLVTAYPNL
jgi:hypothetical protein